MRKKDRAMSFVIHRKRLISTPMRIAKTFFWSNISFSMFYTFWSIYLLGFLKDGSMVGYMLGFMTLLSVTTSLLITPVIVRYKEKYVFLWSAGMTCLSFFMFSVAKDLYMVLFISVVYAIMRTVLLISRGLIVSDVSSKKEIGSSQGIFYALGNIGYSVGPLLAGFIAAKLGINIVFGFSAFLMLIAIILLANIKLKSKNHNTKNIFDLKENIKNIADYFRNKRRIKAYVISGGIPFYWGIIYTYVPMYIVMRSAPKYLVGVFLFGIAVPLVLLEFKAGQYADKHGCRNLFRQGYFIMAVMSFAAFLAGKLEISLMVLILGSFGAALIESTRESYFFRVTKKSEEERYYGTYRTHNEIFEMTGQLLVASTILFFPIKYFMLVLSLGSLFFGIVALKVRT